MSYQRTTTVLLDTPPSWPSFCFSPVHPCSLTVLQEHRSISIFLALILSVVTLSTIMLALWKVEELSMTRTVLQPPFQRSRMISNPDQAAGLTFLGRGPTITGDTTIFLLSYQFPGLPALRQSAMVNLQDWVPSQVIFLLSLWSYYVLTKYFFQWWRHYLDWDSMGYDLRRASENFR